MLYLANPSTQPVRDAMTAGELGCIVTPRQRLSIPPRAVWCADNGCGPGARWRPGQDAYPGAGWPGIFTFDAWLARYAADAELMRRCAFAVLPDVVGDARRTLARSLRWLPRMRRHGYPLAFVTQNGSSEPGMIPWHLLRPGIDWLFIGGDDVHKLGAEGRAVIAAGQRRGHRIHVGRVNSARRWRYVQALGADSCDGTFIARGPDVNLARQRRWDALGAGLFDLSHKPAPEAALTAEEATA